MFKWARALLRVEEGKDLVDRDTGRDHVTRQELAVIFADDLARKVLQKRTGTSGARPRRLMAGRRDHIT